MFIYGAINEPPRTTVAAFNERQPGKNVSHVYFKQHIRIFRSTVTVANLKRSGARFIDDANQIKVLGHFAADSCTSVRDVADICWIFPLGN